MALRYVARRFALGRASGPRVSPSAASRSSQAGYSNGDAGWKQRHVETTAELMAKCRASADAAEAALRHADKMDKLERRLNIATYGTAIGFAGYICYVIERDYGWMFEQGAFSRDSMEFDGADIDEADMEGDQCNIFDV